jgi:hypothetical protein
MAFRYTVGYHEVPGYFKQHREIVDWCLENVGEPSITWKFHMWKCRFRFKRDYTLFLLR